MDFDVVIIGGGHAGIEAAWAAARLKARAALVTLSRQTVGQMSCNPAIGGIAKGHLVREIDALGGVMGRLIEDAGIQFRMLNTRKGPAVRAPRAQADKRLYQKACRRLLETTPGLTILDACAERIVFDGDGVRGLMVRPVEFETGSERPFRISTREQQIGCRALVVCTGTFLNGRIYRGRDAHAGGRDGEPGPGGLAKSLKELNLALARLKTGTPARIDRSTVDFSRTKVQWGDDPRPRFSHFGNGESRLPQVPCHMTATGEKTHDVIRRNLDRSPLYSGVIAGRGPRYCPSIEDKVVKFPDRTSHLVFLEPEGLDAPEIYPNGVSTSLPADVQEEFLRTIPGLERCELMRPGYAVEYDVVIPEQLDARLAVRGCRGLFLAGQINGTSGYEEAAAQGLVAGVNAVHHAFDRPPFLIRRSEAYIGVLIDDLITKIPQDPYRMFTSNAEFRLLLRQDNADRRLSAKGRSIGLLPETSWRILEDRWERQERERGRLEQSRPGDLERSIDEEGRRQDPCGRAKSRHQSLAALLRRPEVGYAELLRSGWRTELDEGERAWVEAEIKYAGYIARMIRLREEMDAVEAVVIPDRFYEVLAEGLPGYSFEARESLLRAKPATLGQASRLPGVRAAHVDLLSIHARTLEKQPAREDAVRSAGR
ncbi:MAG: tRNA uridine-5-carboxymethylaminomethyl(34) synthesis enzyme MnmG [Candidatus Eisenbacteria bacterium]|nr:tRNA uridine-5-carboxymethylaminomethyl(34) synthesis enzyme MnmG [Candidatus Eisenbacteria bacterium]